MLHTSLLAIVLFSGVSGHTSFVLGGFRLGQEIASLQRDEKSLQPADDDTFQSSGKDHRIILEESEGRVTAIRLVGTAARPSDGIGGVTLRTSEASLRKAFGDPADVIVMPAPGGRGEMDTFVYPGHSNMSVSLQRRKVVLIRIWSPVRQLENDLNPETLLYALRHSDPGLLASYLHPDFVCGDSEEPCIRGNFLRGLAGSAALRNLLYNPKTGLITSQTEEFSRIIKPDGTMIRTVRSPQKFEITLLPTLHGLQITCIRAIR